MSSRATLWRDAFVGASMTLNAAARDGSPGTVIAGPTPVSPQGRAHLTAPRAGLACWVLLSPQGRVLSWSMPQYYDRGDVALFDYRQNYTVA